MDAALEITAHNTHARTDHDDDGSGIGFWHDGRRVTRGERFAGRPVPAPAL